MLTFVRMWILRGGGIVMRWCEWGQRDRSMRFVYGLMSTLLAAPRGRPDQGLPPGLGCGAPGGVDLKEIVDGYC